MRFSRDNLLKIIEQEIINTLKDRASEPLLGESDPVSPDEKKDLDLDFITHIDYDK
tara:strand:+ start:123 stop:290 length:168 start_codon:yes stop_codon:yes gene_type:complete